MAVANLESLEVGFICRPAGDRHQMAPQGIQILLAVEIPASRKTADKLGTHQADTSASKGKSALVAATDSGRIGQTGI